LSSCRTWASFNQFYLKQNVHSYKNILYTIKLIITFEKLHSAEANVAGIVPNDLYALYKLQNAETKL